MFVYRFNFCCDVTLYVPDVLIFNVVLCTCCVTGATNTIGRVIAGFISDFKGVNSLLLHNVAILCAGVCCALNMFATTYPLMCLFAAVFGLCFGEFRFNVTTF